MRVHERRHDPDEVPHALDGEDDLVVVVRLPPAVLVQSPAAKEAKKRRAHACVHRAQANREAVAQSAWRSGEAPLGGDEAAQEAGDLSSR
jgi:hypothetical protein